MKYIKIFEEFVNTGHLFEDATGVKMSADKLNLSIKPEFLAKLKEKLGIESDKQITPDTLTKFQQDNNLSADGVLNHKTVLTALKGEAPATTGEDAQAEDIASPGEEDPTQETQTV
jgi:hypothetical protein